MKWSLGQQCNHLSECHWSPLYVVCTLEWALNIASRAEKLSVIRHCLGDTTMLLHLHYKCNYMHVSPTHWIMSDNIVHGHAYCECALHYGNLDASSRHDIVPGKLPTCRQLGFCLTGVWRDIETSHLWVSGWFQFIHFHIENILPRAAMRKHGG